MKFYYNFIIVIIIIIIVIVIIIIIINVNEAIKSCRFLQFFQKWNK